MKVRKKSLSAALGGSKKSRAAQNNQMNLESYCESCHFQAHEWYISRLSFADIPTCFEHGIATGKHPLWIHPHGKCLWRNYGTRNLWRNWCFSLLAIILATILPNHIGRNHRPHAEYFVRSRIGMLIEQSRHHPLIQLVSDTPLVDQTFHGTPETNMGCQQNTSPMQISRKYTFQKVDSHFCSSTDSRSCPIFCFLS